MKFFVFKDNSSCNTTQTLHCFIGFYLIEKKNLAIISYRQFIYLNKLKNPKKKAKVNSFKRMHKFSTRIIVYYVDEYLDEQYSVNVNIPELPTTDVYNDSLPFHYKQIRRMRV